MQLIILILILNLQYRSLYINCIYLSITNITTIGYRENISNYAYGKFLIAIEAMIGQIMWGLSMTLWFVKKT